MYFHSFIHKRLCIVSLWNSPRHGRPKTVENKGSNVRYSKINITFPDCVIIEKVISRNMIIKLSCASVDNLIPRDDIFDYHPIRECNIYIYILFFDLYPFIYISQINLASFTGSSALAYFSLYIYIIYIYIAGVMLLTDKLSK